MNKHYNPNLSANATKLRNDMTKEERHLWYDCLKLLPVTVHRQKVLGNYIVDFTLLLRRLLLNWMDHNIMKRIIGGKMHCEMHT